jgi:S1-C subfamily serine protease
VAPICAAERVECALSGNGYGPSDHMEFYIAGAPVLHFFTGSHLDYHTATDDMDKINAAGAAAVARIVAATARVLAERDQALTYVASPAPPDTGDHRGWGASMGTIPTYDQDPSAPPGMIVNDVVPEGPAQLAGIKAGDRIVEIGTTEIRSVYDLMYVLQHVKPGDKAKVTYVRDDERFTTEVTFSKPRARH